MNEQLAADISDAGAPTTTPERLKLLASHRNAEVRRAVAGNPNTPLNALFWLAKDYAEDVLRNPLVDLLMLENPNVLRNAPDYALRAFLLSKNAPPTLLEWAETNDKWVGTVLLNPAVTKPTLERLVDKYSKGIYNTNIVEPARRHVNFGGELPEDAIGSVGAVVAGAEIGVNSNNIAELFSAEVVPNWSLEALAEQGWDEIRQLVARHPGAPTHVLKSLLADSEEGVRMAALAHPNVPRSAAQKILLVKDMGTPVQSEILKEFARGNDWEREMVARRHDAPPEILEALASSRALSVREAVAENPASPSRALTRLFYDNADSIPVLVAIAGNPSTPQTIIEQLLFNNKEEIRSVAARHPNAPSRLVGLLRRAAEHDSTLTPNDFDYLVARGLLGRRLVAGHPNTRKTQLEELSKDVAWHVRADVAGNISTPESILRALSTDPAQGVLVCLAMNPKTPKDVLNRLASDGYEVRRSVATNPKTPGAILSRLTTDPAWVVRQAVANNPNTPGADLVAFLKDEDREMWRYVTGRERLPASVIMALGDEFGSENPDKLERIYHQIHTGDPSVPQSWVQRFAKTKGTHLIAARHPNCPAHTLALFATAAHSDLREAVASNPNAPTKVLRYLLKDRSPDVRLAVAKNPNSDAHTLKQLCLDEHPAVRRAVLERKDVPQIALTRLCGDEDREIRIRARAHPRTPVRTLEMQQRLEEKRSGLTSKQLTHLASAGAYTRALVASRRDAPAYVLSKLAKDTDQMVRFAVASNPATEAGLLHILASDDDPIVQSRVAENPNASEATLKMLLENGDSVTKCAVLGNPALNPALGDGYRKSLIMRSLLMPRTLNRIIALAAPDAPIRELMKQRNLRSSEWVERLALTMNPSLPYAGLEQLAEDANQLVRAVARQQLALRKRREG